MNKRPVKTNYLLLPFAMLYGIAVWVRNKLFDWKILESKSYPLPVICIGNLAVGGTGKTPHTEHVASLLKGSSRVAVLSRGYGRRTKGFVLADETMTAEDIGDEPWQIKNKFGDSIIVAVDGNRREGIETLMNSNDRPDVILLDDAYQHRYVKPSLTLLLTSYTRLFTDDMLLPAGRLRENTREKHRADLIIVTKCPDDLNPIDYRIVINKLKLYPYQELFFTTFSYGQLHNIADSNDEMPLSAINEDTTVLLLTGIANPAPIKAKLKNRTDRIVELKYPDHHRFTKSDISHIIRTFEQIKGENKLIITTEKDAARLKTMDESIAKVRGKIYVLPIKVKFLLGQQEMFNNIIKNHVRKNK